MLKKWFHVILCLWLINAVTYFHGSNPFDHSQDESEAAIRCTNINTWVDAVIHNIVQLDDHAAKPAHKIKVPRRFVHTRVNNGGLFLAAVCLLLLYAGFRKIVPRFVSRYSIGSALLPAYYNFLFRLNPF